MMSENKNHEFTFSIEDNEYIIKKKEDLEKKPSKNFIHGPSIGIGASVTAICVLSIFFALNGTSVEDHQLIETQIIETEQGVGYNNMPALSPTPISNEVFFNNASPILGDPNAPITLIEFGDYQCHFCNVYFKNTGQEVLENFVATGKVKIIFKDFTIIGPDSVNAAHGTHCANEQNKYWEYHSVLYNNWAGENNGWASKENLVKYADDIELDLESFSECMNSNNYMDTINRSNADGQTLGISGTPAFFIIDHKNAQVATIYGAQPYEAFEKVFNSMLQR